MYDVIGNIFVRWWCVELCALKFVFFHFEIWVMHVQWWVTNKNILTTNVLSVVWRPANDVKLCEITFYCAWCQMLLNSVHWPRIDIYCEAIFRRLVSDRHLGHSTDFMTLLWFIYKLIGYKLWILRGLRLQIYVKNQLF